MMAGLGLLLFAGLAAWALTPLVETPEAEE